jgi:hypothetical protein
MAVRAADTRFVLDELAVLNKGGNPDAEHVRLPKGLAGSLDLNRIGMFGWSIWSAPSTRPPPPRTSVSTSAHSSTAAYATVTIVCLTAPRRGSRTSCSAPDALMPPVCNAASG